MNLGVLGGVFYGNGPRSLRGVAAGGAVILRGQNGRLFSRRACPPRWDQEQRGGQARRLNVTPPNRYKSVTVLAAGHILTDSPRQWTIMGFLHD